MKKEIECQTLSVCEAARCLGIGKSRMYELFESQTFPSFRVGRRHLVRREALEAWIREQEQKARA